ncbi:MAG: fluoride efflux transporter CrcB [Pseudohongiellaceae bacterium]
MTYLAVAFGGALGAMSRFFVYNAFIRSSSTYPWATFTVNVVGSFLIGMAFVLITERMEMGPYWRGVVTVGFLGAFTTFSTFSMDVIGLLEQGEITRAILYVLSSVVVCIIAAWLGLTLAKVVM